MAKKKTTSKTKTRKKNATSPSFEQSLEALKQNVAELEAGNLTLTESLDKYQAGIANLRQCHAALADAKKKIELLVSLDEQGNVISQAFDDSASTDNVEGVRRSAQIEAPNRATYAESAIEDFEPDVEDSEGLF